MLAVDESLLHIENYGKKTGKSKAVSKQIQKNPRVELCCFDGAVGERSMPFIHLPRTAAMMLRQVFLLIKEYMPQG